MNSRNIIIALIFSASPLCAQETEDENNRRWKFSAGSALSLGSTLKFHEVKRTGVVGNAGADADVNNAFSIDLDLRNVAPDAWGFMFGLTVDSERKISTGEFSGAAWGIPYAGADDKIQVSNISGSALYRWTNMYIPFGFNLSRVRVTSSLAAKGNYDESGGVGTQFGLGCYINENLSIELISRAVAVRLKVNDGTTITEYNKGYLSSLNFGAKYIFD